MDAHVVVATTAWILAEMLRYAQKGLDIAKARAFVDSLTQRRSPLVEDVEGRTYFHLKRLSARDVAVLSLWYKYPGRMTKEDLIAAAQRHGHNRKNALEAISRLVGVVDEDANGRQRLLGPGRDEAQKLFAGGSLMRVAKGNR